LLEKPWSVPYKNTCPACGLLCDDIQLENSQVTNTNCTKAVAFFAQKTAENIPQIAGKPATLKAAILKVAQLLKKSQKPIFTGLSTDVAGFRSLFNIAQKTNATLQHMNAASMTRNMKVLQSTGWQTTTLTEVKNRADVIVCFGDIAQHNPRFFERFIAQDGMFVDAKQREIVFIGNKIDIKAEISPNAPPAPLLACRAVDLPEITLVLRALVAGKKLKATEIAGVNVSDLQAVADKLKAAKYAVLAWVAKDLDFPHAELTIQNMTETVAILNQTTRAAGLPLGGSDGDTTANYAHTWRNGVVLESASEAQPDLQIWVNSFNADAPPSFCHTPTIVLGNANTPWGEHADVFIPVATPGLDCAGALVRVDGAVTLPLKKVRENSLPTLGEIVRQIEAQLK
jgi:formylmethanofuran dehydrogenase subunit B